MKLEFNKTEDGNVAAVILNGTEQEKFSYIKMIAALIDGQPIECEFGDGITPEEQTQINALNPQNITDLQYDVGVLYDKLRWHDMNEADGSEL